MDALIPILIWSALVIGGLGLVLILLFGLRKLTHGGTNPVTIGMLVLPGLVFVLMYFVMGDWALAGIWTFLIMLAMAFLALLLSGMRGAFT